MTYEEWKILPKGDWKDRPIEPTCHVLGCDHPTVAAYPAMGGGWASLCKVHSKKHPESFPTDELIKKGAKWA